MNDAVVSPGRDAWTILDDLPEGSEVLAALDLGSNSFHLIVAHNEDGVLRVIDRLRETVRLAAGLGKDKSLADDAMERAIACVQRFGQRLRGLPPGAVRAVGTNTLRMAKNSDQFLARAEEALGFPIDIIAGREEARLIYLGVAHSRGGDARRRLVADIGGGSTELIIGEGFEAIARESLFMGCVSVSRRFFDDGRILKDRLRKAETYARLEVAPVASQFRAGHWEVAVGCSGTFKQIAGIAQAQGWCDRGLTRSALAKLRRAMLDAGHVDKLRLEGLRDDRRPVLPGGVAVLRALFDGLDIESVTISEMALREGLLYDLMGRAAPHDDVRSRSVRELADRYSADPRQASRVARTAAELYAQVAADWRFDDDLDACLLDWAARAHEVGLAVSHNGYHKHAGYLLTHSDLAGFSNQERVQLATLVRAHRRKIPAAEFSALPARRREPLRRLCVLLRMAVLMHRSRGGTPLPSLLALADGNRLKLKFPEGWLDGHALTAADLAQEAGYLEAANMRLEWS